MKIKDALTAIEDGVRRNGGRSSLLATFARWYCAFEAHARECVKNGMHPSDVFFRAGRGSGFRLRDLGGGTRVALYGVPCANAPDGFRMVMEKKDIFLRLLERHRKIDVVRPAVADAENGNPLHVDMRRILRMTEMEKPTTAARPGDAGWKRAMASNRLDRDEMRWADLVPAFGRPGVWMPQADADRDAFARLPRQARLNYVMEALLAA